MEVLDNQEDIRRKKFIAARHVTIISRGFTLISDQACYVLQNNWRK